MFLALLFNVLVGLAFSIFGRERIRIDGPWGRPAFPLVALFSVIIVTPMALYLYVTHPAWAWMYVVDPKTVPLLLLFPLLATHALAVIVGWMLGSRLIRRGFTRYAVYSLGAGLVMAAVLVAMLWERIGHSGSLTEFEKGLALDLFEVKLGYVLVVMVLGVCAAVTFVAIQLIGDSRRATSR